MEPKEVRAVIEAAMDRCDDARRRRLLMILRLNWEDGEGNYNHAIVTNAETPELIKALGVAVNEDGNGNGDDGDDS